MKLTNDNILDILYNAYHLFQSGWSVGMCASLSTAIRPYVSAPISFREIVDFIPEFTPEFFKIEHYRLDHKSPYDEYWWDQKDQCSRLSAFNKLIQHYETDKQTKIRGSQRCKEYFYKIQARFRNLWNV